MNRRLASFLICLTACAPAAAQKPTPTPAPTPAPAPNPAPAPAPTPAPAPPPVAKADEPAAPALQPCKQRRVSFSIARATGMGSYITTLVCSDDRYTVVSDRATTDGREVKQAFQVSQADWERAFQAIDKLGWRTFDDKCTPREVGQGRGDGPVYRLSIEEPQNRRSFICAGARELADKMDGIESQIMALAPTEPIAMGPSGVGVKDCDDYLDRYERCVNQKVPPDKRKGFLDAIQFTRQAMHETLMRDPESEVALAKQCKDMHAAARTAMATFKCKM